MSVSYVNAADFDAVVDSAVRVSLFTDDGDTGTEHTTRFDRAIELASSVALSAFRAAGYNPADDTEDDTVKASAISILVHMAYGRKTRTVPESTAQFLAPLPEAVRSGDLPLPIEAISNTTEAVGGALFTSQDDTTTSGGTTVRVRRRPVMRDLGNDL